MSPIDEHLNWLALQYVLGELPAAECEAFEQRLSDDPLACEAVAATSRLALTTRQALMETAPDLMLKSSGRSEKRAPAASLRGSWIAVAAAVTAASLVWALFVVQRDDPADTPENSMVKNEARSAAELVSLWRTGVPATDPDSDDSDVELADTNTEVIPDWMLAAVSIQSGAFDKSDEKLQEN